MLPRGQRTSRSRRRSLRFPKKIPKKSSGEKGAGAGGRGRGGEETGEEMGRFPVGWSYGMGTCSLTQLAHPPEARGGSRTEQRDMHMEAGKEAMREMLAPVREAPTRKKKKKKPPDGRRSRGIRRGGKNRGNPASGRPRCSLSGDPPAGIWGGIGDGEIGKNGEWRGLGIGDGERGWGRLIPWDG